MNDIIKAFVPSGKIKELRSNQVDCLNKVYDLLSKGEKRIEIELPPGSGKSIIADTIMNYFANLGLTSIVTSPQNLQVDQYATSGFNDMVSLKGREHYPCIAGKKNASEGTCRIGRCPDGVNIRSCQKFEYASCRKCVCFECVYKKAHNSFKKSTKGNTNLTLYLLKVTNSPSVWIVDEADTLSSELRSFKTVVAPVIFPHKKFPEVVPDILGYMAETVKHIAKLREKELTEKQEKEISTLESIVSSLEQMLNDYKEFKEPWCITEKETSQKTKFEPVLIERFLKDLFQENIVIMMSATPPHFPGFVKVRGESIFPISSRQWIYDPFPGSMILSERKISIPRLAVWLNLLKGKTLVHCKGYKTAEELHRNLQIIKRSSLLQVSTPTDPNEPVRYSRYDAVKAFLASKNPDEILISVHQGRGLDLWQPEIINNVIAVVPWFNKKDPLTKLRIELQGEEPLHQEMANDVAQQIARHFRNEHMGIYLGKEVPKRAYIVDASWGLWYNSHKGLFPKNFTESERL